MTEEEFLLNLSPGMAKEFPSVDRVPTHVLAQTHGHDVAVMLACAKAEADSYWSQTPGSRSSAAPGCFERAAILLRKQKRYAEEVRICEEWVEISQSIAKEYPDFAHIPWPCSDAIHHRLAKARILLSKSLSI
ncbi:hypothetical protein [Delftia acidovorans]|uniref:hypothetical protein n=1 Tax=Delftia acidovorans TaxID=80866 RepID=UPI0028A617DE|nr:hypothetical protein [Delftia acidovorans]